MRSPTTGKVWTDQLPNAEVHPPSWYERQPDQYLQWAEMFKREIERDAMANKLKSYMPIPTPPPTSVDEIEFDEARHIYTLKGMVIPSVTQVIDPFISFRVGKDVLEKARLRGTLVHALTEAYDMGMYGGEIQDEAIEGELDGYVDAYERFLVETGCQVLEIEQRVYHAHLRFAGTLDRVVMLDGVKSIIDIKSGESEPEYKWQTAAYQAAYNSSDAVKFGNTADHRYVLELKVTGRYKLVPHPNKDDFDAFKAALTLFNWRSHG